MSWRNSDFYYKKLIYNYLYGYYRLFGTILILFYNDPENDIHLLEVDELKGITNDVYLQVEFRFNIIPMYN